MTFFIKIVELDVLQNDTLSRIDYIQHFASINPEIHYKNVWAWVLGYRIYSRKS